ncbi:hypothetical protein KC878_03135 [Candidatus Saccharibacteria bacterium]|nr:hypothetical protein [Candidatus Saccharibacteria bacterium]MCB9821717.1 hypothetical protein [Candidatus Nomurabacteria bacterium]
MTTTYNTENGEPDYLVEVALASKDLRCQAIAARLVDQLLNSVSGDGVERTALKAENLSLAERTELAQRLFEVYLGYPEAFECGFKKDVALTPDAIFHALPMILREGGLPLVQVDWGYKRVDAETLDQQAEMREQVAKALCMHPPSADFVREHQLVPAQNIQLAIDKVIGLLNSANEGTVEGQASRRRFDGLIDHIIDRDYDDGYSKLQATIGQLEQIVHRVKDKDFKLKVQIGVNNFDTSLRDLIALCREGAELVEIEHLQVAAKKQAAFGAVLSGEAANYISPRD